MRINTAAAQSSLEADCIRLLAVSKKQGVEKIRTLYGLGLRDFGENYTTEALQKQKQLKNLDIEWHYIGPLQSNKTKAVAEHFQWVQSLDRPKLIQRLARQRPKELPPLQVLIQVNIDREPQKSGISPEELPALARQVLEYKTLNLRGLMAIPMPRSEGGFPAFPAMKRLYDDLKTQYPQVDTLSMGMSADLEAAIREGSTMVRVGTALMGERE